MTNQMCFKYIIAAFIFSTCTFKISESARILCIYPVPYNSHQYVFRPLTEALARRGHQLVVVTPLPTENPIENVTQIDVHDISYKLSNERMAKIMMDKQSPHFSETEFWTEYVYPTMPGVIEAQFDHKEMQDLMNDKNQKFDLLLIEACTPMAIMARIRFQVPVIMVSSLLGTQHNYQVMGAALHPWLFPDFSLQKIHDLSFWDKMFSLYTCLKLHYLTVTSFKEDNKLIKKRFGPDAPTIQELHKHVEMLFINSYQIWDNNRPVPPSVIYMGALHLKGPKTLPKELDQFMNTSKNGVIYMSMGSKIQINGLPQHIIEKFLNVFAKLPYDVLLKWNGDETIEKPKNVRIGKWFPQNDLLHHLNLKVFITHGGLQSTDEAIAAQIPLVGIPFMVDQFYNVQQYVKHGIGEQIFMDRMTEVELEKTILTVAENKKYRENFVPLAKIMKIQREGGLERAVFWTEYVASEGAQKLRSPLVDAYLTQHFLFDTVIFMAYLTISTVFLILVLKFFSILYPIFNSKKQKAL